MFGLKKILVQNSFLIKKNVWSEKNLGLKQILSSKKMFWPRNFGSEKGVQKVFLSKKFSGQIGNMDKCCHDISCLDNC